MDTLPSELLKYVCHCLDQSSLRTSSEVSSSCRAAAIDTLFRQDHIYRIVATSFYSLGNIAEPDGRKRTLFLLACLMYLRHSFLKSAYICFFQPSQLATTSKRLATSRNLYSLAMHYDYINSRSVDYNEYAVKDMVLGAAPNLKEVYLYQYSSGSDPWTAQAIRAPKELWRTGRIVPSAPAPTRGRLERLELINRHISIPFLESWHQCTDLSVLRTLKIYSTVHTQELRWLSENCHLDSLEVIALDLHEEDDPVYEEFWLRIPPLKSLRLSGSYGQRTLRAIVDRHAATLETLLLVTPEMENPPEHGSAGFASQDFLQIL
ncbi:hypothetical protein KC354_g124 [Hortaea werneckii]|nr:hypothetical protein KC354_g124 [Hortaea werneckii]